MNRKYKCVSLGHTIETIQMALDRIDVDDSRIVGLSMIGFHTIAIVECPAHVQQAKAIVNAKPAASQKR